MACRRCTGRSRRRSKAREASHAKWGLGLECICVQCSSWWPPSRNWKQRRREPIALLRAIQTDPKAVLNPLAA